MSRCLFVLSLLLCACPQSMTVPSGPKIDGGGGGDPEARSALDSLARRQGALTGG